MKTLLKTSLIGLAFVILSCEQHQIQVSPKPSIIGRWNWVKNLGGITGHIQNTPESTGHHLTYLFNKDLSCIQIDNMDTVQNTTYTAVLDTFHLSKKLTNILTVSEEFYVTGSKGQDSLMIITFRSEYSFSGDTLILKTDAADAYTWWYLRSK